MIFQIRREREPWIIRQNAYRVLVQGRFSSRELRLHVRGGRKEFPEAVRESIEQSWSLALQEAASCGRRLFNGKLFSLREYGVRQGYMNLLLGETDYKELLGTHGARTGPEKTPEDSVLSHGLTVCSTILAEDGCLILGKRSQSVHRRRGKLHVCAGHPNPESLMSPEQLLSGENLLFSAMKSEIQEEFNIFPKDISQMSCLGLIRGRETRKPELVFETVVKLSSREIIELFASAQDRDEHEEILTVRSARDDLGEFLSSHREDFTVPGLAALIFHGADRGYWTQSDTGNSA